DGEGPGHSSVNSIYMMSHSGARGSPTQMRQLAAMRGLMAKPSGEIIETPIISNFKEGLTVLEYFNSTHGARKGLADTALKTANSGYLTRRLVDVAQDCVIVEEDCGTDNGIIYASVVDSGEIILPLTQRVLGRVPADPIANPETGEVIVEAGEMVEEWHLPLIEAAQVQEVRIRSVLTCETRRGVCGKCYGRDLSRGTKVNMGESIGVIAAQSIGEPGTQLTMRTFHIGGTAQVADQSSVEATFDGSIVIEPRQISTDSQGRKVVMARSVLVKVMDGGGKELASHKLAYGAHMRVDHGDKITRGTRLAEWDPYTRPILSEADGKANFEDLVDGMSVNEQYDESTGITNRVIIDWRSSPKGSELKPAITVTDDEGMPLKLARGADARYLLSVGAILSVEPGKEVKAGDVLARIPLESAKTRDITGGLPRVAELFEARRPKDHAVIAEISGTVEYGRDYKNKRRIAILPDEEDGDKAEYLIPKGRHLSVQEGDRIEKGEYLLDGNPAPHDILAIKGVEELAAFLVNEVQ
ncbi:MAG: DNA-directed RNA polymerase subunit beta', partial [Pseudomonadota bacterium]